MASFTIYSYDHPIRVRRSSEGAESWQYVHVSIGKCSVMLSREEAAQLAVDLLDAADADDAEVAA